MRCTPRPVNRRQEAHRSRTVGALRVGEAGSGDTHGAARGSAALACMVPCELPARSMQACRRRRDGGAHTCALSARPSDRHAGAHVGAAATAAPSNCAAASTCGVAGGGGCGGREVAERAALVEQPLPPSA